jgi:DNA repair protein RadC
MARRVRRVTSRLEAVIHEGQVTYGQKVDSPVRVAKLLEPLIADRPQEVFVVLMLDGKHRVFGYAEVSLGTLTTTLVHPRETFGPAIRLGAAAIVVAHVHPSGDAEPSREDIELTKRLIEAGKLLGIPLLDHLILGDESFVSLRSRMDFGC